MRYELKYRPTSIGTNDCFSIIREHPAAFKKIFPDRIINNIYFDSPNLVCYQETMDGVSERKKFRLRWYNDHWDGSIQAKLEVKIKENQIGSKVTTKAPEFTLPDGMQECTEALKIQGYLPISFLAVSTNQYLRSYFGTDNEKFRITIDRDLRFGSFLAGSVTPTDPADAIIVELKYAYADRDEGDWVRQWLPFRRTRFSKYAEGILKTLA